MNNFRIEKVYQPVASREYNREKDKKNACDGDAFLEIYIKKLKERTRVYKDV